MNTNNHIPKTGTDLKITSTIINCYDTIKRLSAKKVDLSKFKKYYCLNQKRFQNPWCWRVAPASF